jgi:hypothetical protein
VSIYAHPILLSKSIMPLVARGNLFAQVQVQRLQIFVPVSLLVQELAELVLVFGIRIYLLALQQVLSCQPKYTVLKQIVKVS